ncbi:MAG: CCA tRNA nucleotidyltransferase [Paracoccaceae bacterium]
MKLAGDWIRAEALQRVLHLLTDAGHRAFLVGGCVRNALFGLPVTDIDIATDAIPKRVQELAVGSGLKVVPTGIEHGTVTIVVHGEPFEVTTFRRDVETDGRRATVAFASTVEEDASRRDFTMNALYADADGCVIDPLDGLADLQARRVRFVGDPDERIREDYLRILRFFRFHALYGDAAAGMDEEALSSCAASSAGLTTLSKERIGHEMRRLLGAPDPAPAIAGMVATGVLGRILPGADHRGLAPLVHLDAPYAPDWVRRLAVLGVGDGTDMLRLSREEARRLAAMQAAIGNGAGAAEMAYRLGAETARDVVLLRAALSGSPLPDGWEDEIALGKKAMFPVRAADLQPGLEGGALGAKLNELEERWIASAFQLTRDELLA